jgi:hypothetical protein
MQPCRLACGVQVWSTKTMTTSNVKVMRVRADGPGAVKDRHCDLT